MVAATIPVAATAPDTARNPRLPTWGEDEPIFSVVTLGSVVTTESSYVLNGETSGKFAHAALSGLSVAQAIPDVAETRGIEGFSAVLEGIEVLGGGVVGGGGLAECPPVLVLGEECTAGLGGVGVGVGAHEQA